MRLAAIPVKLVEAGAPDAWLWVCSDLHVGSAHTDYRQIEREVDEARRLGAVVVVNGDILDAILPGDRKRFELAALHPRVRSSMDIVGESIRWAVELLGPVAPQIADIGAGNHDHAVKRIQSFDPVSAIANELGVRDAMGGYHGYVRIRLCDHDRRGNTADYVVYRHHGFGGSARMTLGLLDLQRLRLDHPDADLIVVGHKHNQILTPVARFRLGQKRVVQQTQILAMTGGYTDRLLEDALEPGYATRAGMQPQPTGGLFVRLRIARRRERSGGLDKLTVEPVEIRFGA